ncbi:family 16 glycosylhydrolase [Allorhizocola rhizosphaerae]|uniref:family 16 glycosylhydrolase n=1 Tax=Allorhizocola rhizosphaerae TaxID=1872709 RepID=UPI000E3E3D7A|nr:family 16 glycosylhydrolase [Allorhizocola rhizosphaerae]
MNSLSLAEFAERLAHRIRLYTRVLDPRRRASAFSQRGEIDALGRIYVINLDRKPARWRRVRGELDRFHGRHGERLSSITRRFPAVDARYMTSEPDHLVLRPTYTLADQLTVEPNPLLALDDRARAHQIGMSRQEIAVALSHIELWRRIADGDDPAALILEDDVFLAPGFARRFRMTWSALLDADGRPDFDLIFLAYKDVTASKSISRPTPVRRQEPGIWEAAAYVLTRAGACKLLSRLPAYGPIDMWLNLQFASLRVFTAGHRLIEQRVDEPSTNSYSILPVLSQVGVIAREKPLLPAARKRRGPVIAFGDAGLGLTSLAKALSMLGYTCISDVDKMPTEELDRLVRGRRGRMFNAYVNVGGIDAGSLKAIASANRHALFIATSHVAGVDDLPSNRLLRCGSAVRDKWAVLSEFLEVEYPPFPYPDDADLGRRATISKTVLETARPATNLKADASPWVLSNRSRSWQGIRLRAEDSTCFDTTVSKWSAGDELPETMWKLRDDTFPSNLALFIPENVAVHDGAIALTLRAQRTSVREYTGAAMAGRGNYLYGTFGAELRPSNVTGVITGLFLHRNGPRHEIDIEFLGRNTTKMLVNVFYNPGPEGTKLEYGYRGTPTEIDLGFDASDDFHFYEIDWQPSRIAWKVDGVIVYERPIWYPTPLPDRPLEYNVNLWHSRSTEFAGYLDRTRLPAVAEVRSIVVAAEPFERRSDAHHVTATSRADGNTA